MVLNKVLSSVKWTAETVKGAVVVLASPNEPIPPTKMHPRMMAWPWTPAEWMQPAFRLAPIAIVCIVTCFSYVFATTPSGAIKQKKSAEEAHHRQREMLIYKKQRAQDKLHFQKYDPLRPIRPHAFDMAYKGGGH